MAHKVNPKIFRIGTIYNWAWFVGFLISSAVYLAGMKARG